MANPTIAVDDGTLKKARMRALGEDTSVNAVLREYLEEYAGRSSWRRREGSSSPHASLALAQGLADASGRGGCLRGEARTVSRDGIPGREPNLLRHQRIVLYLFDNSVPEKKTRAQDFLRK
jgi:hypothetical protein